MKKISVYILIPLLAAVILSTLSHTEDSNAADNPEITIVYSSMFWVIISHAAAVKANSLGGLYKRSTYLNNFRKEHGEVIIVDSGDLLNENEDLSTKYLNRQNLKLSS